MSISRAKEDSARRPFKDLLAKPLTFVDATHVRLGRRRLVYFAGCDYFRLASHPRVLAAARDAITSQGLNVAASRITTGNHPIYRRLERSLARFFGVPAAVVFSNGYVTNSAVAQALAGDFTHAFLDERAHSSLADASALLRCPVIRFGHRDQVALAKLIRKAGRSCRPIVMTDGLCAHDGGVAPLRAYLRLLPSSGWLLVDDSHGAAIVGEHGGGAVELEAIPRRRVIQTSSLSKGFGVYGGVVLCPATVADRIAAQSRLFSGNTPLPPPLAAGVLASIAVLRRESSRRRRLRENAAHLKGILRAVGLNLPATPASIVALPPTDAAATSRLRAALLKADIYPSHTRYPGTPADGYFRFVISSEHTREQLDRLLGVLVPCLTSQG